MKRSVILGAGLILALIPSFVSAKPKYISPNSDGVDDELVIPLNISEKRYVQAWKLVVMDSDKNVVREIGNKVAQPEKIGFISFFKQLVTPKRGIQIPDAITWNGAMNNGETAPDGSYYYYITATDDNGNVGKTKEYEVIVDTVAPEVELAQPSDRIFGEGAKSAFRVRQSGSVEDEWTGVFRNAEGTAVKTYKWTNAEPAEFSWYGTDDTDAQVQDGVYTYEVTATDRAGNVAPKSVISNIIYSADKPSTNIYVDGTRYFSPRTASKNGRVTFNLSIPVPDARSGNRLTEWNVDITDSSGKTVRTFRGGDNGSLPPSSLVFDGTDDSGNPLADGEYKASVHAKYLNGYEPAVISSPVVVLDTKKPEAQIRVSDKVFGAGSKNSVEFSLMVAPSAGTPVNDWSAVIMTSDRKQVVKTYELGEYPPQTLSWNGICDDGTVAQKGDYIFVMNGTDLAGNAGGGESNTLFTFDTTEAQLLLAVSDTAFSPDGNGVKDTLTFSPVTQTQDVVSYVFNISDGTGKTVYTEKADRKLPLNFVWNGKDGDGILCADGIYTASLSVTAANGSSASATSASFEVDTVPPSAGVSVPWTAFSPDGDGNQDVIHLDVADCTSEKLWTAEVRNASDKAVRKYSWTGKIQSLTGKPEFEWDGTDESGNKAPDGKYSIVVHSTDDAGNSFFTEIAGLVLDSRETKIYVTAEYDGISPNGDGVLDAQKFTVRPSVTDGILSWNFDIRKEDGTSVYGWSDKDSADLPANVTWNGTDRDGKPCEGTFTGTLNVVYSKGNRVSAVSSPFVCTATPPQLKVQTAPEYFSPDNDGVDDDLFIKLSGTTKASVKNWSFVINDPKGKPFWRTSGKSQITERIVWDGLSNVQKDSRGNAERVQSAMDYPYKFTVTDTLGMTSSVEGVIPVDVLVIRDGNVLKMAVPSIIFLSNEAEFQKAAGNLTQDQVDKNIQILNRIAEILKKFKDYKVTVVGHANRLSDNVDEETVDNPREWGRALMPLSKERADAIKAYLVKRGVNASNLTADGRGGTQPVVNPKDRDNNWKNRRVEFILQK